MTSTSDRWRRAQEIFLEALELPADEAHEFIAGACSPDDDLESEVRSLLAAHGRDGFLAALDVPSHPADVGPYEILDTLGEGGMGVVYLARRREADFEQRVALKIIRSGFADPRLEGRFLSERRILAQLQHAGIARLIDGGVTEAGQPYYTMEYVEGVPLHDHCDGRRLGIRDRLSLFLRVCGPVAYAHGQLVVHRDLKPSNILVTADGQVKLLDFGIAKLLDADPAGGGLTRTAPWITPAYASPEQVRGLPVTTAADVYALGILLYEMLTGLPPHRFDEAQSPAAIERAICHEPPERPSSPGLWRTGVPEGTEEGGWNGDAEEPGRATGAERRGRQRGSAPERLRRSLAGDLDTIVLKALAKEPDRRYASVQELADDVRRHLDGRPVLARPDTVRYRAGKFVKRHRSAVVAATVAALSLMIGSMAALSQARRASQQAELAADEAAKASQVASLMTDLFRLSDPTQALGDTVTAREVLDRGAERIERELADQPAMQATMLLEVARIYENLGLLDRAETHLRRAVQRRDEVFGPSSLEYGEALGQLGEILARRGNGREAADVLGQALAIRRERVAAPDTGAARLQSALGWRLRDLAHFEEAEALFTESLETRRALLPEDHVLVAESMLGLASAQHDQGSLGEAEETFRRILEAHPLDPRRPTPGSADAAATLGTLALLRDRHDEAEPLLKGALDVRRALYEPNHPALIQSMQDYGALLARTGRYSEAQVILRDGLERAVANLGTHHPEAVSLRVTLNLVVEAVGAYEEAMARDDSIVASKRVRYRGDHPDLMFSLIRAGGPPLELGYYDRAETMFDQALEMGRRLGEPEDRPTTARMLALSGLARIAAGRGRAAEAETRHGEVVSMADELLRPNHRYRLRVRRDLAEFLIRQGRPAEAVPLLEENLRLQSEVLRQSHPVLGLTRLLLGEAYAALGRSQEAAEALEAARRALSQLPPDHPRTVALRRLLGRVPLADL